MLELSLACQITDRTRALIDGRVSVGGCRINFVHGPAEELFQRAFRHEEFDISELSLGTHLLTTARGQSRYIGVPAFVSRSFRHSAIYVRADRGIDRRKRCADARSVCRISSRRQGCGYAVFSTTNTACAHATCTG